MHPVLERQRCTQCWIENRNKNELPVAKHIYTLVSVPLWSQNFNKRPIRHRVGAKALLPIGNLEILRLFG
jgi:hypothetical protein